MKESERRKSMQKQKEVIRSILKNIVDIRAMYDDKLWDAEMIGVSEDALFIEYLKSFYDALMSGEIDMLDFEF